ncbi:hypothetical protein MBCUT_01730 [Methanobrevibacter cuticularis]|uniref:DUF6431 domain-containing protein n=2 Tax=Methanobrevibacter cuticularis TaxID=47311 RepID=A0A166FF11_9EURY|nr:hypothetical protein MBCUT_01730 [Methanobrevibacter cuticularis]
MIVVKTTSPISNVSDVQYKFFVFGLEADENYKKKLGRNKYSPNRDVIKTAENVYIYADPFCKHCNSRKVSEYGHNDRLIIDKDGKKYNIVVKRYKCSSCGKFSQTSFNGLYEPYCNFSNETKDKSVKNMELDRVSLRNTSKTHKNFNNVKISHETVRKSCLILNETYFTCDIGELSGYYGYDEQWVKINGEKWKYRCVLFDLIL